MKFRWPRTPDEIREISFQQVEWLLQGLEANKQLIEERDERIRKQNIQIENMIQALLHARKKRYGSSTEVTGQVDGQLSFFETVQELAEQLKISKEKIEIRPYKRTPRQPGIRKEMLAVLPEEIEEYVLPKEETCSVCGGKLKIVGKRVVRTGAREVYLTPFAVKLKEDKHTIVGLDH